MCHYACGLKLGGWIGRNDAETLKNENQLQLSLLSIHTNAVNAMKEEYVVMLINAPASKRGEERETRVQDKVECGCSQLLYFVPV